MSNNIDAINKFRKEIREMMGEVTTIDKRVFPKAVAEGFGNLLDNTPVDTSTLRKHWSMTPLMSTGKGYLMEWVNPIIYASWVNYGHNVTNMKGGPILGYVRGKFFLENAIDVTEQSLAIRFNREVERLRVKYGK